MTPSLSIFVVDRDRDMAEGLAELLETAGHRVTLAFSGEDAVRILTERGFDVSFINVKLPGMSGIESFLELHRIRPGMRAIMMTGYTIEQLLMQAVGDATVRLVQKPYEMEAVLGALDAVGENGLVLVAEHDPTFCDRLRAHLAGMGLRAARARTGKEALAHAQVGAADVLVLDLRLPFMSGLEIFLQLKRRGNRMVTVMVSGLAGELGGPAGMLHDLCVGGILAKPFDPSKLLEALDTVARAMAEASTRPPEAPAAEPAPAPTAAPAPPPPAPAPPAPAPRGRRLLVIDDDYDLADGLAEVLASQGHEVRTARSAAEVRALPEEFEVEVALVDIQLGHDNGLATIEGLKTRSPNLQAVVVSAKSDQRSAIEALRRGADDYLNKPLDPRDLFEVLERCFERIDRLEAERLAAGGPDAGLPADLAHDLRDPLNAVIGFSEILRAEMLGPLGSEQYRDYAADIGEAGQRLTSVIDGMAGSDADEPAGHTAPEDAAPEDEAPEGREETGPRDGETAPAEPGAEPGAEPRDDAGSEAPDLSDPLVAAFYDGQSGGRAAIAPGPAEPTGAGTPVQPVPGQAPIQRDSGAHEAVPPPRPPAPPPSSGGAAQGSEWATGGTAAPAAPAPAEAPRQPAPSGGHGQEEVPPARPAGPIESAG